MKTTTMTEADKEKCQKQGTRNAGLQIRHLYKTMSTHEASIEIKNRLIGAERERERLKAEIISYQTVLAERIEKYLILTSEHQS